MRVIGDHSDGADVTGLGDAELADAVRRGDPRAADELFRRHADPARRYARTLADEATADDLVSEAFTRLLGAFEAGNGPQSAVRPYLIATVRNVFVSRLRADRRTVLVEDLTDSSAEPLTPDGLADRQESNLLAEAFRSLPERWQTVLWHTSVEGAGHDEVGRLLGLSPNAVGALAFRAREGLRRAYLEAHLAAASDETCRSVRADLPAYVRDRLDPRRRRTVDAHLRTCAGCTAGMLEIAGINERLGALLAPALLGASAGAAYLGTLEQAPAAAPGVAARGHRGAWVAAAVVALLLAAGGWWALASSGDRSGEPSAGDGSAATSAPTDAPSADPTPTPTTPDSTAPTDPTDPTGPADPADPQQPGPSGPAVPAVATPVAPTAPTSEPTPEPTPGPTDPTDPPDPPVVRDRVSLGQAYQSDFGPYRHVEMRPRSPFGATYVRLTVPGLQEWTLHDEDGYRAADCVRDAPAELVCHVGAGAGRFGLDVVVEGAFRLVAEVYADGYDDPRPDTNRVELTG